MKVEFFERLKYNFLYKNKLCKNNDAESGKNKNKLRTIWGWEVWKQKMKTYFDFHLLFLFTFYLLIEI